jgi:hypothetical protein
MKYLVLISLMAACSSNSSQLTEKAKDLEVYSNKPVGCTAMDRLVGIHEKGSKDLALNHALNQAAKLGATGVYVNQEVPNGNKMAVHVTAYRCD